MSEKPDGDALDQALAELEAYGRDTEEFEARHHAFLLAFGGRANRALLEGVRKDRHAFNEEWLGRYRDEIKKARNSKPSDNSDILYKSAWVRIIAAHFLHTKTRVNTVTSMYDDFPFWADTLGLSPQQLVREDQIEPRLAILATPRLTHKMAASYYNAEAEADRRMSGEQLRCNPSFNSLITDKSSAAWRRCEQIATEKYCDAVEAAFEDYKTSVEQRMGRAGRNFDRTAQRLIGWTEGQITISHNFAVRWFKHMKPHSPFEAKYLPRAFDWLVQGLLGATGRVPSFIGDQAEWYQLQRQNAESALEQRATELREECIPVRVKQLERLAQEEWEALREMLEKQLKSNLEVEYGYISCELKVGSVTISLSEGRNKKWSLDATGGLPVNVSLDDSGSPVVTIGGGRTVSTGPFAGSGEVTIIGGKNPKTGKVDGGIVLTGKTGFGYSDKKGRASVACYPSSVSVKIWVRATIEDAIKYHEHVRSG